MAVKPSPFSSSIANFACQLNRLGTTGRANCSLAATDGVHIATNTIKTIITGAHAVQVVSAPLRHGPAFLKWLRNTVAGRMEANEYEAVRLMTGSMNLRGCPNLSAYEPANYVKILQNEATY